MMTLQLNLYFMIYGCQFIRDEDIVNEISYKSKCVSIKMVYCIYKEQQLSKMELWYNMEMKRRKTKIILLCLANRK